MIKTEKITRDDGVKLIRTYSDRGMLILQKETGVLYGEAIDLPGRYTYEETEAQE